MSDKQKPAATEMWQVSAGGTDALDVTDANKAVSQLISKASEVLQDGDQHIYVLSKEVADEVLGTLQVKAPEVFVQTNTWSKPAPSADNKDDTLLAAMGTHLQSGAAPEEARTTDQVQFEYGDQAYVLPDEASAREFIANLAAGDATAFQQTKQWNKQPPGVLDGKLEAAFEDIAARLQAIEAVLLRMEAFIKAVIDNR